MEVFYIIILIILDTIRLCSKIVRYFDQQDLPSIETHRPRAVATRVQISVSNYFVMFSVPPPPPPPPHSIVCVLN